MSGRHQCTHQTLRRGFLSNTAQALLTPLPQQIKDIEDKLEDLIPWLTKLKDTVTKASFDDDHEEEARRERLTRFASHLRYHIGPN